MTDWFRNHIRIATPALVNGLFGLAAGTLAVITLSRVWLNFSEYWELTVGVLFATVSGLLVRYVFQGREQGRWVAATGLWTIAIWSLIQPSVLSFALDRVFDVDVQSASHPWWRFSAIVGMTILGTAPLLWGISAAAVSRARRTSFVVGVSLALCWMPIIIGGSSAMSFLTWSAIAACVAGGILSLRNHPTERADSTAEQPTPSTADDLSGWVEVFVLGVAFALALFVIRQLILPNLATEFSIWSGLLIGGLIGTLVSRFDVGRRWGVLGLWSGAMLFSFPFYTWLTFQETLTISNVWLLFLSRELLIVGIMAPLGFHFQKAMECRPMHRTLSAALSLTVFSGGFLFANVSQFSPRTGLIGIAATGFLFCLVSFIKQSRRGFLTSNWQRSQYATAAAAALLGLLCSQNFDFSRTEKILYSGNTFAAARAGIGFDQLPWIDDSRLLTEFENASGRWSVWRHRGNQRVIRRNGLPTSLHTNHVALAPHNPAEVLPCWLPLVLHPMAENVLVLGLHTTSLVTCESFPLLSTTVFEGSDQPNEIRQMVRDHLEIPERFQFVQVDPNLGLKCRHAQSYDVITAPQSLISTTSGTTRLTREYYLDVRRHLAEHGIFSQRLSYVDIGAETLREVIGTFRSVFSEVIVTESVPGELLLLGTTGSGPLITEATIENLQSLHARRMLSQAGWDWTLPAVHGLLDTKAVDQFLSETTGEISVRNPVSAFALPLEIARWADKFNNSRMALTESGTTMIGLLGDTPAARDLNQRITDIQLAQRVVDEHPDNIWSYRAAIKKQLTDRPRSKIMQVAGEGLANRLHPEDQRRKDYLTTLGSLVKDQNLQLEELGELLDFNQPYDPLVSDFAYFEALQLIGRIDGSETAFARLNLLLHSIYYTPPHDRSVRNVCAAVQILADDTTQVLSSEERWDQLNALLEILRYRWQMRYTKPQTRFDVADAEASIEAIEAALQAMQRWRPEIGLTESDWQFRKSFVESHLLQSLTQFRSRRLRQVPVVSMQTN